MREEHKKNKKVQSKLIQDLRMRKEQFEKDIERLKVQLMKEEDLEKERREQIDKLFN